MFRAIVLLEGELLPQIFAASNRFDLLLMDGLSSINSE